MRSRRFEPALRGISEEHVLAVVADVTDISVPTLRGPARGGPAAEARCLAGYLLKRVSALEKTLGQAEQSARVDKIIRKLRAAKSGFWTDSISLPAGLVRRPSRKRF